MRMRIWLSDHFTILKYHTNILLHITILMKCCFFSSQQKCNIAMLPESAHARSHRHTHTHKIKVKTSFVAKS